MNRRDILKLSTLGAFSTLLLGPSQAALVPPQFLDCVVALGFSGPGIVKGVPVNKMWHTIGTGFFYGQLMKDDPEVAKRVYSSYLVTAKHVIDGYNNMKKQNAQLSSLRIRINPTDTTAVGTEFDLLSDVANNGTQWINNPHDRDVSVISVNLNSLRDKKYKYAFFASDIFAAKIDKLRDGGVSAGDGVFVLGFPMDLAGIERNYVIARQGVIARISEIIDKASDSFLIDSFVFPGNSGGPVLLKPDLTSIEGTKSQLKSYLIGLVVESVEYTDTAMSQQTGRARISFEENSGLAIVLPVDYIEETVLADPLIGK